MGAGPVGSFDDLEGGGGRGFWTFGRRSLVEDVAGRFATAERVLESSGHVAGVARGIGFLDGANRPMAAAIEGR